MSRTYIGQYAPGDADQEAENLITRDGQRHSQTCRERDSQSWQYRSPHHLSAGCTRSHKYRGQRDPDRHLMDEDTKSDKPGGNRRRFGADAQNETVGEIVDRKTQDKRPERVFMNTFLWRVVRMRVGKRLGQEQEGESSDETRYRRFSREFQAFGEEIGER